MNGPLSGIKVVELSTYVTGPVTARLLGDMGAQVIKVEAPSGDGRRVSDVSEDEQAWANGFVEHVLFRSGNVDVMPTSPIEMASATPPATAPAPPNGGDGDALIKVIGAKRNVQVLVEYLQDEGRLDIRAKDGLIEYIRTRS